MVLGKLVSLSNVFSLKNLINNFILNKGVMEPLVLQETMEIKSTSIQIVFS